MRKLLLYPDKAKVDVKDHQGKRLLDIVLETGHRNVVDFLKAKDRKQHPYLPTSDIMSLTDQSRGLCISSKHIRISGKSFSPLSILILFFGWLFSRFLNFPGTLLDRPPDPKNIVSD